MESLGLGAFPEAGCNAFALPSLAAPDLQGPETPWSTLVGMSGFAGAAVAQGQVGALEL